MNTYRLRQYFRYRLQAKGRHGTHSPFIYAFVEDGLGKDRHQPLLERIRAYFQDWEVVLLDPRPGLWAASINRYDLASGRGLLFIVPGIHGDKERTAAWDELRKSQEIPYSIDLFSLGLLVAHKDFKEKQHFVLKR